MYILVEVRYDTARSWIEDGKGFLTIRVSCGMLSHSGERPGDASSPDSEVLACSEVNALTVQKKITDLCNSSPSENNINGDCQLSQWYFLCFSIKWL